MKVIFLLINIKKFNQMKKKIAIMLSAVATLLILSAGAFVLNAARCKGVDGDRGTFKCKGTGECVIVQGNVSIKCSGKRVYDTPLVVTPSN